MNVNLKNINKQNVQNIREQIQQKKNSNPYFADIDTGSIVLTDYDNFPYNRWYRGEATSFVPIVAEREAGWRPIYNNCYKNVKKTENLKQENLCFENACSTVYPCYPEYINKFSDTELLSLLLDNSCVISYR